MIHKVGSVFDICKLLINCPNFPKIIWIILAIECMRNVMLGGIYSAIFTTMEMLRFTIPTTILMLHCTMFIRGMSYLVGAWLADSYFGKYTIYLASIIVNCFILHPVLCFLTVYKSLTYEETKAIFIALIYTYSLVSFGSGCAMPLYSEQFFLPEEEKELRNFYIITFWLNNFSFLIGTSLFQLLIHVFSCFHEKCIAIPIFAYIASDFIYLIVIFGCRKKFLSRNIRYKVVEESIHLVLHAAYRATVTARMPGETRRSALDLVRDSSNRRSIKDAQRICNLLPIFLSLIGFWTTKGQLQISWLIQTSFLSSDYYFNYRYPQIIILMNTLFIIIFVPIVYIFIVPLLKRGHKYLKWAGFGIFFMFLSLWMSSLLQNVIEKSRIGDFDHTAYIRIYNSLPMPILLDSNWTGRKKVDPFEMMAINRFNVNTFEQTEMRIKTSPATNWTLFVIEAIHSASISYVVKTNSLIRINGIDPLKDIIGPIVYFLCAEDAHKVVPLKLKSTRYSWKETKHSPHERERIVFTPPYPGIYDVYLNGSKKLTEVFYKGGIYCILINNSRSEHPLQVYEVISPNIINIDWMILQFFFSALAETFAWVPMHLFVYIQSPPYMRATTTALFLFLQSLGYGMLATSALFENHFLSIMITFTVSAFILLIVYTVLSVKYKPKLPKDQ